MAQSTRFGKFAKRTYERMAKPHIGLAIGRRNFTQLLKEFLEKELSSSISTDEQKKSIYSFLKVYPQFSMRQSNPPQRMGAFVNRNPSGNQSENQSGNSSLLLPHEANLNNGGVGSTSPMNQGVMPTNGPNDTTGGSKKRKQVHKKKSKKTKKH
jgi:hypothetical protein